MLIASLYFFRWMVTGDVLLLHQKLNGEVEFALLIRDTVKATGLTSASLRIKKKKRFLVLIKMFSLHLILNRNSRFYHAVRIRIQQQKAMIWYIEIRSEQSLHKD